MPRYRQEHNIPYDPILKHLISAHCKLLCQGMLHLHNEMQTYLSANNQVSRESATQLNEPDEILAMLPLKTLKTLKQVLDRLALKSTFDNMVIYMLKCCVILRILLPFPKMKRLLCHHKSDLSAYTYALCHLFFSAELACQFTQKTVKDQQGKVVSHGWGNIRTTDLIIS
jgi:hypothetical protein